MTGSKKQPTPQRIEHRKRRREWGLILLSLLLVFALTQYESRLLDLTSEVSLVNSILVLALINVNILLIILFFFLVFRNLFKLILERRRGVPGARIRSKLVVAFVALSLVPTMLLFFVSAGFITNTIENWFNNQIENSLQESLEVAETYYKNSASNALYYGEQLARIIKRDKLLNEANLEQLKEFIQEKQLEYNLGIVEVFSSTYEELVRVSNPSVPAADFTDPGSDAIREALQGNRFTRITPVGKADLIRGIVPVYSNWNPEDVVGVVVVNYYVPYSLVSKMKEIKSSFEQYKGTKLLKGRIQMGYVVVLLLIALVIIFLATWFGFHLARGITVPIQELAVATNRIAQGDLDVRIEVDSDDEIGTLVDAFNTMTADLRRSQKSLQAANRELQSSNLELDQRRRYMEIVLRNITAGVVAVDRGGFFTTVNKSAEKLLNTSASKVLGKNFREVLEPEYLPLVKDILRDLMETGKDHVSKQVTIPIQENKLTLMVNVTTLRDENGEFMGTVVVFDDLTQLIKAQRMAAWREVARRIAHEIKNPLTPIQLSAQRLRRRYLEKFSKDDTVFDECTGMIIRQVDELKNLVNEFSNFARMPASRPTPNNLNQIVAEALILFEEGHKEIDFSFDPDPEVPVFNLDRDQIKRSVINLIDNAVGAMDQPGTIHLETHFNHELKMVTLTVKDTGCGIAPDIKSRLFEPYFSTKKTGTGLGLAIVSTIISDHNGYIRVRDNRPKGTQFIIELPITDNSPQTHSFNG
ncbi:sensor histidine kinase [Geoalkalibacter subterraneus]|uniref:histidine kinase n=1 Tax=Geoalkalibacter subterraneus TaxID=483547 RepID=A0A0B5FSN7_9BACT|nr:ATP-binding protein [Geoalkalibacter subterraneus]AJF07165.1 histidine kinase [Geoalkalibacter subterraneus]